MYIDKEIRKNVYNTIVISIRIEDNVHIYGKNVNNKKNKKRGQKKKHE